MNFAQYSTAAFRAFFIGNWFYGLCAVALSVEATLQQRWSLPGPRYHLLLFLAVAVFYTHAYRAHGPADAGDERVRWYARHHRWVGITQALLCALATVVIFRLWRDHSGAWAGMTMAHWVLLLIFPLVGLAYYGKGARGLRRVGWLKPFIIGFTWAGTVTVYPVLFRSAVDLQPYPFALIGGLLFLKNFMFIALLCILFDIKDHASDHHSALRTFVVQRGLRATIFRLVVPLAALGLGTFLIYGTTQGFSLLKLLLNTVPFIALFAVAYSLRRRRSILYYLTVVDGLMLLKAVCGIVAMRYF